MTDPDRLLPPRNPFRPGIGTKPPCLGLDPPLRQAQEWLQDRFAGPLSDADHLIMVLHGATGMGKRTACNRLAELCLPRLGPTLVLDLHSGWRQAQTPAAMEAALRAPRIQIHGLLPRKRSADDRWSALLELLGATPLAGLVSLLDPDRARPLWVRDVLHLTLPPLQLGHVAMPLLTFMDKAHVIQPAALELLLDTVARPTYSHPRITLMTCSSALPYSLFRAHRRVHLRRLSVAATRQALEEPLRQAGFALEPAALTDLQRATEGYPWFVQLYGQMAFCLLHEQGAASLDLNVVRAVRQRLAQRRHAYIINVWGCQPTPAMRLVAQGFRRQSTLTEADLQRLLKPVDLHWEAKRLAQEDFIMPGSDADSWEPVLPSVMAFLAEEA